MCSQHRRKKGDLFGYVFPDGGLDLQNEMEGMEMEVGGLTDGIGVGCVCGMAPGPVGTLHCLPKEELRGRSISPKSSTFLNDGPRVMRARLRKDA